MPGDDVVEAGGNEEASGLGVGAVDEYLVVDAGRVGLVGDVDKPEGAETAGECPSAHPVLAGDIGKRCGAGDVGVESAEIAGAGFVGAAAG